MYVIRKLLKSRTGFTLVELMVVVVVLGILAGIAVQRMGDVRDRTEEATQEANIRLLLGAANLAKAQNFGTYMFSRDGGGYVQGVIRWQRPCQQAPVTQVISQVSHGYPITGYSNIEMLDDSGGQGAWNVWIWNGQDWDVNSFLESFPIGYAVEIIYTNRGRPPWAHLFGAWESGYSTDPDDYREEKIIIYKYLGDVIDDPTTAMPAQSADYWSTWDPYNPSGNSTFDVGNAYPYHHATEQRQYEADVGKENWLMVFP